MFLDRGVSEVTRIQAHIARAEGVAAARDLGGLTQLQQVVRALLLEELAVYRERGVFPKNPDFETYEPYFIDAEGTRCAMAHLMEFGGAGELVARIAATRNNARVHELADEPELLAWLEASGLTVDEAAAIQPTYGPSYNADCICNSSFSTSGEEKSTGVLEVTLVAPDEKDALDSDQLSTLTRARIDAVHGVTEGYTVGAELTVRATQNAPGGAKALVALSPMNDGPNPYAKQIADGIYQDCSSDAFAKAHPLTSPQIADAWLAGGVTQCRAKLKTVDPGWAEETSGGGPMGLGGCSAQGGHVSAASSMAILIAILGVLAARRAARTLFAA